MNKKHPLSLYKIVDTYKEKSKKTRLYESESQFKNNLTRLKKKVAAWNHNDPNKLFGFISYKLIYDCQKQEFVWQLLENSHDQHKKEEKS